ncbi:MAG: dihydrolipoyl dehydrogenase [Desulfobacterales bacterium]|nr:dihydrolipoyl dehydrogenase [Desulfobacterales bacterium]MDP6808633.1 dihydrolipoyl dehydrogenase [Desulfobacterales bacterium]
MTINKCDLLVIGGGPGGYTAAIRAAQKGLQIILVERGPLGGTCLNRGCVPTKTLLEDTFMISRVRNCHFMRGDMKINLKRIAGHKDLVVEGSCSWVQNLLAENGVTLLRGEASFSGPKTVTIKRQGGELEEVTAPKIILATGAVTIYDAGLHADGERIWSTDDALSVKSIPRSLAVIGAGNRGVEFASIYHNLGTKVVIIEKEKRILPRMYWELADRYKRTLLDRQIKVLTHTTVLAAHPSNGNGVILTLETAKGRQEVRVDRVLMTGVRRPAYHGINFEATDLVSSDGILEYGPNLETKVKGIYVVGDAAGPPYLAHKAIVQGMMAVNHILGKDTAQQPLFYPNCVYGNPEVATVGLTEDEALESGRSTKVGEFHFIGNGRSGTIGNDQGLVMIVSDSKTMEVLGVHMIGPQVTELISLACLAMQNGIDVSGIKKTVFAHPTLAETFFEAALATDGEAIHLIIND